MKTHGIILLAVAGLALEASAQRRPAGRRDGPNAGVPHATLGITDQDLLALLEFSAPIDGRGNNRERPELGSTHSPFARIAPAAYADGVDAPAGVERPGARAISNLVVAQLFDRPNGARVSDFVWQWGQFLDHDVTETPLIEPPEDLSIPVPVGDPWFDPAGTGVATIRMSRSFHERVLGVRQQVNGITAFVDASNVYGSDAARAVALRALDGTGRLKTGAGDLLPFNEAGLANAPSADPGFFLAGDLRANEQCGLLAMHTLFVREHNHWADLIRARFDAAAAQGSAGIESDRPRDDRRRLRRGQGPVVRRLTGDEIYRIARTIVAAEIQVITYREFLPVLLGRDALGPYRGYRSEVDPSITNEFATASYRFGHSMLSPQLLRLDARGRSVGGGPLPLDQAFFNPDEIRQHGIEPLLRGLAAQRAQEVDVMLVDAVRNFLFGPPGSGGFDLASLNVQRGRDHGLPGYTALREALGLDPVRTFDDVSSDPQVRLQLAAAYRHVDHIDAWVGGLAEDHVPGALLGATVRAVLTRQFRALRDGDRYWYQHALPRGVQDLVEAQNLAKVIRRNTSIGNELRDDLWHVR